MSINLSIIEKTFLPKFQNVNIHPKGVSLVVLKICLLEF